MTTKPVKTTYPLPALSLAFATLVLAVGYLYTVTDSCVRGGVECFYQPLPMTGVAPFRYRLLAPALQYLFAPNAPESRALLIDVGVHTVLVALLLPALFLWLRRWVSQDKAVSAIMILSLCFTVAYHFYLPFGTTIIELTLLCLLLANIDGSFAVIVILVILDSFNRETALLLVAAYGAWHGWAGKNRTIVLFVIWAGITAGLHVWLGPAPHIYGLGGTFERNIQALSRALIYNAAFVPLWIMTLREYRYSPAPLKRMVWVAGIYAVSILVGASWEEVRLLLPLLPLVMPVMLKGRLPEVSADIGKKSAAAKESQAAPTA